MKSTQGLFCPQKPEYFSNSRFPQTLHWQANLRPFPSVCGGKFNRHFSTLVLALTTPFISRAQVPQVPIPLQLKKLALPLYGERWCFSSSLRRLLPFSDLIVFPLKDMVTSLLLTVKTLSFPRHFSQQRTASITVFQVFVV